MDYKGFLKRVKGDDVPLISLFQGEEHYLIDHTLKYTEENCVDKMYADFNYVLLDKDNFSVKAMLDHLNGMPLFAAYKLVVVKHVDLFKMTLTADEEDDLKEYFESPADTARLIIVTNSIDKRKKTYKACKKVVEEVSFDPLSINGLEKWIIKKISDLGAEIDFGTARYFADHTGYVNSGSEVDLYQVESLCKKMISFNTSDKTIDRERVDKFVKKPVEHNIFAMMDALNTGQLEKAYVLLNRLFIDGEAEIKIFASIVKQLRNISKAKMLMKEGHTSKAIADILKIHPYAAQKACNQSKSFATSELSEMMELSKVFDRRLKRSPMEKRTIVELFMAELASLKRN